MQKIKTYTQFINESLTDYSWFNADEFVTHMEAEMSWNGASLTLSSKPDEQPEFEYSCYEGSSVSKDLKEAAAKIGVGISVDKQSPDFYYITVVKKLAQGEAPDPEEEINPDDVDYSELSFKMDKYMPEEPDSQEEYHALVDAKDEEGLAEYIENNADDERMGRYMPDGGTVEGFAKWLIANK